MSIKCCSHPRLRFSHAQRKGTTNASKKSRLWLMKSRRTEIRYNKEYGANYGDDGDHIFGERDPHRPVRWSSSACQVRCTLPHTHVIQPALALFQVFNHDSIAQLPVVRNANIICISTKAVPWRQCKYSTRKIQCQRVQSITSTHQLTATRRDNDRRW